MKVAFPAKWAFEQDGGERLYLCQKHGLAEIERGRHPIEDLGDYAQINCAECHSRRMND